MTWFKAKKKAIVESINSEMKAEFVYKQQAIGKFASFTEAVMSVLGGIYGLAILPLMVSPCGIVCAGECIIAAE